MQILYISTKESFDEYIKESIQNTERKEINFDAAYDIYVINTSPIKVEHIRNIIGKISSKPTQLKSNYIVIYNFQEATESAQNAFLKTLEEGSCSVFLHATSKGNILETILSRVKIVQPTEKVTVNNKLVQDLSNIISKKNIGDIQVLCKTYSSNEIYNALESIFEMKIKNNNVNSELIESYKTLMQVKKVSTSTTLNTELQVTNIMLGLLT